MTLEIVRTHPKPPVGGWSFFCHGTTFSGRSVDDLITSLTEYRTQNSLPLGNPEHEIAAYLQTLSPFLVRESADQPIETTGTHQRVAEQTMSVWYGKYERLPHHDPRVEDRMAICAVCPSACHRFTDTESAYWHDAVTKAALMTGDMAVEQKGFCQHHHWILGLATRLVSPEKLATLPVPAGCWVQST